MILNRLPRSKHPQWLGLTLLFAFFFLWTSLHNLGDFREVQADEVWISSVAESLATREIFGSEMFAGFFEADRVYFIALPAHHYLQAGVMRLFGSGIAQARLVSVLSGLVILISVSWLAYRWFSLPTATLAMVFLLFWRSGLITPVPEIPLSIISRSARYDGSALAWMWLSLVAFDRLLTRPIALAAILTGLFAGLAALSQFFGIFILVVILFTWFSRYGLNLFRGRDFYLVLAGLFVLGFLYLRYVQQHPDLFTGQTSYLKADRVQFSSIGFYLENLIQEYERYLPLFSGLSPGRWIGFLLIGLACYRLGRRGLRKGPRGNQVLFAYLAVNWLGLFLVDQTKVPLYLVSLVPGLCIAIAILVLDGFRWLNNPKIPIPSKITGMIGISAILLLLFVEGLGVQILDFRRAGTISRYDEVGNRIRETLEPGSEVLASPRWWWLLKENHPFLALNNLWAQWEYLEDQGEEPEFSMQVYQAAARYLVINDNVRGDIQQHPKALEDQFWDFIEECTFKVVEFDDQTYGDIEVYEVSEEKPCE